MMVLVVDLFDWCRRQIPVAVGLALLQVLTWSFDWKLGFFLSFLIVGALYDEHTEEGGKCFDRERPASRTLAATYRKTRQVLGGGPNWAGFRLSWLVIPSVVEGSGCCSSCACPELACGEPVEPVEWVENYTECDHNPTAVRFWSHSLK